MKGLLNRLWGQVRLRVECPYPERVLNLCSARNLAFWDLQWEDATTFTCRLSRRDCAALRQTAERLECRLTVLEREGVPFFLGRFRHRQTLAVGLVGGGLALFLGSFFIWDFTITGNEAVPDEEILRALEDCGVTIGSFGLALDGEGIRNHVLLDIPELSWIAVNVSGCRAEVQVRERVEPPELLDEVTPTNVVARRAGLVLEVRDWNGRAAVLPGSAVTEGQMLISGVEDLDTLGARVIAGNGSVQARTWYSLTTTIPLTGEEKRYTGEEKTRVSLVLGKQRIKFFSNSSITGEKYDKITKRTPWSLLGVPLPVTVVTETYRFYETEPEALDVAQAEARGEAILREQLEAMVAPYGTITSTLCSSRQRGETLEVTLAAECVEEIAQIAPIYTEEAEETPRTQE